MDAESKASAPPTSGTTVVTIGITARFFFTFLAVAKILEVVLGLLVFVCTLIANGQNWWWWSDSSSSSFVAAVSIMGALASAAIFVLALIGVWWKLPLKVRLIVDALYCGIWVIFMLCCALLSAQTALPSYWYNSLPPGYYWYQSDALMATAVFSAFDLIVYSMDLLVAIQKLLVFSGRSIETIFALALLQAASNAEQAAAGQSQFSEARY